MLAEAAGVEKIVIACGRTDLRKGIDGLAQLIDTKYEMNPFEKNVLFLFCGGRGDRIKGLLEKETGAECRMRPISASDTSQNHGQWNFIRLRSMLVRMGNIRMNS